MKKIIALLLTIALLPAIVLADSTNDDSYDWAYEAGKQIGEELAESIGADVLRSLLAATATAPTIDEFGLEMGMTTEEVKSILQDKGAELEENKLESETALFIFEISVYDWLKPASHMILYVDDLYGLYDFTYILAFPAWAFSTDKEMEDTFTVFYEKFAKKYGPPLIDTGEFIGWLTKDGISIAFGYDIIGEDTKSILVHFKSPHHETITAGR